MRLQLQQSHHLTIAVASIGLSAMPRALKRLIATALESREHERISTTPILNLGWVPFGKMTLLNSSYTPTYHIVLPLR